MKIVVTGGSGFLGKAVVEKLAIGGQEVLSLSRGQTTTPSVTDRRCDILDTARLAELFKGQDCVVHCAALSSPWGKRQDFLRQNVEGTTSVVAAAARANVKRLIHISSSSVYFSFRDQLAITEDASWPNPANTYAESKQKAEIAAAQFSNELFILRPRGIYGPGDLHLLPRLLRVMKSRPLPLLRSGKALVDLSHVLIVADAIAAMTAAKSDAAGTYNVSHGKPISIKDLIARVAAGLNIENRWRKIPVGVAMAAAKLLEAAARLDPKGREPLVTAYGLGLFAYSQTLDISKAARNLHWRPQISLDQGLEQTFANLQTPAK